MRVGKALKGRLGLVDGHEVMNPAANVKTSLKERGVYDSMRVFLVKCAFIFGATVKRLTSNEPPQPANLLTAEAIQLACRASVDNMLAATVKNFGVVMNCAAPVYADAPVEKKS